jgi:uncharacterized protein (DUF302 family)
MTTTVMRLPCSLVAACFALLLGCSPAVPSGPDFVVRVTTDKPFDDVIFELEHAITERNFRITGRNKIGQGLRERGYKNFPDLEVIHFCNLELAREVLLIDPGFIVQMPCRITVHSTINGQVISLILIPDNHHDERVNDFARRMNGILREIVQFALEEDLPESP